MKEILEQSGVHPLKARNAYVFGSQVYGYAREDSDYDVVLVAPTLDPREHKGAKYNIHVVNPDRFSEEVKSYQIRAMECLSAPEWARLQERMTYEIVHDPIRMKQSFLTQSAQMWNHAKHKMNEGDIFRGLKSIFHALKLLTFGTQIVKHGKIVDFGACNDLHEEVMACEALSWKNANAQFIQRKRELEKQLTLS